MHQPMLWAHILLIYKTWKEDESRTVPQSVAREEVQLGEMQFRVRTLLAITGPETRKWENYQCVYELCDSAAGKRR
jgi:hypothetical protein